MNDASASRNASAKDTDYADTADTGTPSAGSQPPAIEVTWVRTVDGSHLGKVQAAKGKWPVSQGAKSASKKAIYETAAYAHLKAFFLDYAKRQREGCWAIVGGAVRPGLDPAQNHPRNGTVLVDAPRAALTLDFDGLEPSADEPPLDTPEAFAGAIASHVADTAIARLPRAFKDAGYLLLATNATGLPFDSKGEPSNGRGRFRLAFPLTRALTCTQRKRIVEKLKTLDGLACLDPSLHEPTQYEFVSRPIFLSGESDPIKAPVLMVKGGMVDVDDLAREIGLDLSADTKPNEGKAGSRRARARESAEPPIAHCEELRDVADAIVNGPDYDDRGHWVGHGHVLRGVFGRERGRPLWLNFGERWVDANGVRRENDPAEDERVWDTLGDSDKGVWDLCEAARLHGGEAGWRAYYRYLVALLPDLTEAEKKPFLTFAQYVAQHKPLSYVVEGLIASGSLYALTARTSHGKTAFLIAVALAVATGTKDAIGVDVKQARVAYLTFENPDGVRMRMMAAAHKLGLDANAIGDKLMICSAFLPPEKITEELRRMSAEGGPFGLVIVDTFQAAFIGDDTNNNNQVLGFVRRFRPIAGVSGNPAIVMATHPVKNADKANLIPYGGGALLNEIDGNFTLWKEANGLVELHWLHKLRGLAFDPKSFTIELHEPPTVLDDKGRPVRLPVLTPLSAAARARRKFAETNDAVLVAMFENPTGTMEGWGNTIGRNRTTVSRALRDLQVAGLVVQTGDKWKLTVKGRKQAEKSKSETDEGADETCLTVYCRV